MHVCPAPRWSPSARRLWSPLRPLWSPSPPALEPPSARPPWSPLRPLWSPLPPAGSGAPSAPVPPPRSPQGTELSSLHCAHLFYTWRCAHISRNLSVRPTLLLPHCVHSLHLPKNAFRSNNKKFQNAFLNLSRPLVKIPGTPFMVSNGNLLCLWDSA